MPSHWKGVIVPIPIIPAAVFTTLMMGRLSPLLGALPILAAWALVMWICERHSPSRR